MFFFNIVVCSNLYCFSRLHPNNTLYKLLCGFLTDSEEPEILVCQKLSIASDTKVSFRALCNTVNHKIVAVLKFSKIQIRTILTVVWGLRT